MRLASDIDPASPLPNPAHLEGAGDSGTAEKYADYKVIRRNGSVVAFEPTWKSNDVVCVSTA